MPELYRVSVGETRDYEGPLRHNGGLAIMVFLYPALTQCGIHELEYIRL